MTFRAVSSYPGFVLPTYNVLNNGLVADGATDNTAAMVALLSAVSASGGGTIVFPYSTTAYAFTPSAANTIQVPSNTWLAGIGKPLIKATAGTSAGIFQFVGVSNVRMSGLWFDLNANPNTRSASGFAPLINNCNDVWITDCDFQYQHQQLQIQNSHDVHVDRCSFTNSAASSVSTDGSYDCIISNCLFVGSTNFGIIITSAVTTNPCYRITAAYNRTGGVSPHGVAALANAFMGSNAYNGNELVGLTSPNYDCLIEGNNCTLGGDNGFSISGFNNRVIGNTAKYCAGNGIECYGGGNTVTGNTCIGNAIGNGASNSYGYRTGNAGWFAGIALDTGFGGTGSWNTVTGNYCDDDQVVATQLYGIKLGNGTAQWVTSTGYTTGNYVYYQNNLYQAASTGTSGATPPTHVSGTVSDGGVSWTFLRSYGAYLQWVTGANTVANQIEYFGSNLYQATGGTLPGPNGATAPTVTSGSVSDGNITWTYLRPYVPAIAGASGFNRIQGNQIRNSINGNFQDSSNAWNTYDAVGLNNVAAGANSYIVTGSNNTISSAGNTAVILNGTSHSVTGSGAVCIGGSFNSISGQFAVGIGTGLSASGFNTTVIGRHANDRGIAGVFVYAADDIAATGDAQMRLQAPRAHTTDATATKLTMDTNAAGSANQFSLANNTAIHIQGVIIAHETATPANCASWTVNALASRGSSAATTALVASTVTAYNHGGTPSWSGNTPVLAADTSNGCITTTVTGAAATTINWVFGATVTEVG